MTDPTPRWDALVIGGGAAGVFAAIHAKEASANLRIAVLEGSGRPLRKVAISGGGRCNVTHNVHDLEQLLACYPRGGPRLRPILERFMPEDTVRWFERRGVRLKSEPDGRMFPTTDRSETVVDTLLAELHRLRVPLITNERVRRLEHVPGSEYPYRIVTKSGEQQARRVLLATGGGSKGPEWLGRLGHRTVADVPSLFTFCSTDPLLAELSGVSWGPVRLTLPGRPTLVSEGSFLITHWGVSGPSVLKLSAFAARTLFDLEYRADLLCDWLATYTPEELRALLLDPALQEKTLGNLRLPPLPKRFWRRLLERVDLPATRTLRSLSGQEAEKLGKALKAFPLPIAGKGAFKEEFVTAGGLPLTEVYPYTLESRHLPGLFAAGELLDVDGITGGYNFQAAWASGYIAGFGLATEA